MHAAYLILNSGWTVGVLLALLFLLGWLIVWDGEQLAKRSEWKLNELRRHDAWLRSVTDPYWEEWRPFYARHARQIHDAREASVQPVLALIDGHSVRVPETTLEVVQ